MPAYRNQRLFSDHYLQEILPQCDEWKYIDKQKLNEVSARIQSLYQKKCKIISSLKESQLEEEFIRPILRILGHIYTPHPSIHKVWEGAREPDYAFYPSEQAKKEASIEKTIAIGEVKRYRRPLDRKLKDEDPFEVQNPSLQMSRYLWLSEVRWGILTDGRFWRLYERETSKRIDIFYEIDLEKLLKMGNLEDFKYFYLFFRREAFPEFLQRVYSESLDYAEKVGEELKENIYRALKILVEGFLKTPQNNLTTKNLTEIHDNSLVLLYRLIFALYAEYRRLLPLEENELYTNTYSLDSIKKEVRDKIDRNVPLSRTHTHYWGRLEELFETINSGDPEMSVPLYNGGLFDPQKHPFLEEYKVADFYIAKIIDLLARSKDKAFIDYSSLEIRHLGSIYEGLLEYKIEVAEENLIPIKRKGKGVFVPLREAEASGNKIRENEIIRDGELYLVTDKGERKASGSYYTPDYVVKYIVENTLGPVVEEKKKLIKGKIQDLQNKFTRSKGYNREVFEKQLKQTGDELIDEILNTKVLDPAMGSGHFLVEATDFLAHTLVEALSSEIIFEPSKREWLMRDKATPYGKDTDEDDIRWARREVVERCIYGVDLNPLAVELAKLSLWLYTVAKGKPLNFLDHHLKCGNSLIGARIDDLANLPRPKKRRKEKISEAQGVLFDISPMTVDLGLAVGDYFLIEGKPTERLDDIRNKEKIYQNLNKQRIDKWRAVANLWTSSYFGVNLDSTLYKALSNYLLRREKRIPEQWVKNFAHKASKIAKPKRFFHWELEFPEVFFDRQGKKLDNPGFDVVIGNPPYDVISAKEQERRVEPDKLFLSSIPPYRPAVGNKLNFYRLFVALSLNLLRERGIHGFIVPMALLADKQARLLRKFILKQNRLKNIEAFPQKDNPLDRIFLEAKLSTCVYIVEKHIPTAFSLRVHPGKHILESSPTLNMEVNQIEVFDKANLSIPCYPDMTTMDFQLALKLIKVCKHRSLRDFASSQQGEVNLTSHSELLSPEPEGKIVLRGAHVNRYEFVEKPKQGIPMYLDAQKFLALHAKDTKAYDHLYARIGYQRGSAIDNWRRIIATTIEKDNFCSDTINYIVNPKQLDLFAILALLNSSLWEWRFRLTSTNNHINAYEIDSMPIPRICFVTPKEKRETLVEEGKELYHKYLDSGNWDALLFFVGQRLEKQHHPDPKLVKKYNVDPLHKDFQIKENDCVEQSDVVHDLLALLAERMIEYNKEKNKEIKSFLGWLEREVLTIVEDLTGKTTIKKYHETTVENLISILKKNKKKLHIDASRRDFQDKLSAEFNKSVQRLTPLKRKIEITDRLIDQIVYKLYGLTEEEIKIVEKGSYKVDTRSKHV
jgi:Alw26I/Eco31I/Esp3I family type II restriction m6 adenine DNA methyltransferase